MRNNSRSCIAIAVAISLLSALSVAAREPTPKPAPIVRIGLIRSIFLDTPEPLIRVAVDTVQSAITEQTGMPCTITVVGDPAEMSLLLKNGKLHLAVFHGFEFAWARAQNPDLKPFLLAVKHQQFVRSVLVVRQESKAASAADLRGQTFALPRLARQYARIYLERRCLGAGLSRDEWFGKVSAPTTDQDALGDVAERHADATIVDDVELEAFRKNFPKTASKLRVLQQSEVFPSTVVAYQPGTLDKLTFNQLRTSLMAAKTTKRGRQLLDLFRITGFEKVPADFEQMVADIAKAYPRTK